MGNYQSLVKYTHKNHYIDGSVILITGASSGLGKQIAIEYSRRKAKLIITGRNKQRLEQTAKICKHNGSQIYSYVADVSNEQDCKNLITFCLQKFKRLNILVLNAGVNAHFSFPTLTDTAIIDQLMRTNYYANVYLTKYALPHLQIVNGQIVVISSMSGKIGTPSRSAYCASKFATSGFFEALRTEDLGVAITTVYPPSLKTPMRDHDLLKKHGDTEGQQQDTEKRQDPAQSAKWIVIAADHRVETFYFPLKPYLAAYLSPIFPEYIRNKVKMAAKL